MDDDRYPTQGRGRSEKKRQAQAVAKLATRLMDLPAGALSSLPLDEDLRGELMELRRTRGHASIKRSLKHFAGSLRGDDEAREQLQAALSHFDDQHQRDTTHHQELEQLRERLCAPQQLEAALQVVAADYPSVDLKALRHLINAVERGHDKRAFREIFRRLREGKASR